VIPVEQNEQSGSARRQDEHTVVGEAVRVEQTATKCCVPHFVYLCLVVAIQDREVNIR
jgi:hypothetical protein